MLITFPSDHGLKNRVKETATLPGWSDSIIDIEIQGTECKLEIYARCQPKGNILYNKTNKFIIWQSH